MLKPTLVKAVEDRSVLAFIYDDKARIVEPHAVGTNKAGKLVLRAYQLDGESATNPRSWKLFIADKIEFIETVDIVSQAPRPGYKVGDAAMAVILAELEAPVDAL